jgi:hypothetical protein
MLGLEHSLVNKTVVAACLFLAARAFGGTSGIHFVYQPLTTLGTEQDTKIIIAKIPVITNAVPESIIGYISAPHKLQQREQAFVDDSNLLSRLGIVVSAEWVPEPRHYVATLDLSAMKPTADFGLAEAVVVDAALDCIRRTIEEMGGESPWKVRVISRPQDGTKWNKYETEYRAKAEK